MIYTMNVTEELANQMYPDMFNRTEFMIETVFTKPERIFAYDTYQFNDYDKYLVETFDKIFPTGTVGSTAYHEKWRRGWDVLSSGSKPFQFFPRVPWVRLHTTKNGGEGGTF